SSTFASILASSTTLATNVLFSGLAPNTTYFTRVNSINYAGVGSNFQTLPSTITLAVAPGASAFTNVTATQITANWTAGTNPVGTSYIAQVSTDALFNAITSSANTTNTSAVFPGLTPYTTYFARVQAVNFGGSPTLFTLLGSTTTAANPPTQLAFTNVTLS